MEEKILNQIEESNETSSEKTEGLKKCREERRQYLKSLLESKEGYTTAEKLAKIQPFIEKLENYTWQELKSKMSFGGPNDWVENQGWSDSSVDNPHWYGFAYIVGLCQPNRRDGVYFRIDTLERDGYDQEYKKCRPTLKIDGIKMTLNLKKTDDTLISNAEAYKRLLKDRLGDQYGEVRKSLGGRTVRDSELGKRTSDERFSGSGKRRPRRPVSKNIIEF